MFRFRFSAFIFQKQAKNSSAKLFALSKAKFGNQRSFRGHSSFGNNYRFLLKYIVFTPLSLRVPIIKRQMATLPDNEKQASNNNNNNKNNSNNSKNDSTKKEDSHKHTNHLINEQSPYLLQHAHNPVNWYPWSEEAFNLAAKENKPIFLSVGYSTCHWCHVMEHESFEDETIAKIMNDNFICIKVDREERPDVDKMYMTYVTATTQHGGWPMSVWLTPSLKPIFGGTYFPKNDGQYGQIGFKTLLLKLAKLWKNDQIEIETKSERVINILQKALINYDDTQNSNNSDEKKSGMMTVEMSDEIFDSLYKHLYNTFDSELGGFGNAPKFPRPCELNFLLRYYYRHLNSEKGKLALAMTLKTLTFMGNGGMFDHLGGGFHRYSVDEYWHVPHFEKMLYDNGQLIVTYLNAYQITKKTFYLDIAKKCLEYIMRDMTDSKYFGIYSAEDADSYDSEKLHKKEGLFYIWTEKEIDTILGNIDNNNNNIDNKVSSIIFKHQFFIKTKGNATLSRRSDPHLEFTNQNILYKRKTVNETLELLQHMIEEAEKDDGSKDDGILNLMNVKLIDKNKFINALKEVKTIDDIELNLNQSIKKMFEYRNNINQFNRYKPDCDDKIIVAWNGLMISAFAKAHQVIGIACDDSDDYDKKKNKEKENEKEKDSKYLTAASKCAQFIYKHMRNEETGHLYRIFRNGVCNKKIQGFSADYSYLIQGLLDLYEASFDAFYLEWAIELQTIQIALFYDSGNNDDTQASTSTEAEAEMNKKRIFGGFYESLNNDKHLLIRQKEDYDGAEPSSTSIAINNLLRLYKMCDNNDFYQFSVESLNAFLNQMKDKPIALPQCIVSLDNYIHPLKQIIFSIYDGSMNDELVLGNDDNEEKKMDSGGGADMSSDDLCKDNEKLRHYCKILFGNYYPDTVLLTLNSENKSDLEKINNELKYFDCSVIPQSIKQDAATRGDRIEKNDVFAHVCDQYKCNAPTNNPLHLEKLVQTQKTSLE